MDQEALFIGGRDEFKDRPNSIKVRLVTDDQRRSIIKLSTTGLHFCKYLIVGSLLSSNSKTTFKFVVIGKHSTNISCFFYNLVFAASLSSGRFSSTLPVRRIQLQCIFKVDIRMAKARNVAIHLTIKTCECMLAIAVYFFTLSIFN